MSKRKDWLKFWGVILFANCIVFTVFSIVWWVLRDSEKIGFIAMPITLWVFAMVITLFSIFLIEKEESTNIVTLKTARGDVLLYNPQSSLTLEAEQGAIKDLTVTPLDSFSLELIANSLDISSLALNNNIYINNNMVRIYCVE